MAQRILAKAQPSASQIDSLIAQMETTLGKTHVPSPFPALYQQYSFSTENKVTASTEAKEESKTDAKPEEEEKKAEQQPKKQKKEKKEKKPSKAAAPAAPALPEDLDVFSKCDLRVGKIVECTRHPDSEKLYVEKIDLGEETGLRTIGSGLQEFVPLEEMTEGLCIVFANLKPRKLADLMSQGMVMCAGNDEHTAVEIMRPAEGSKIGERVQLEGNPANGEEFPQEFQPILNPKRKLDRKMLEYLRTNDQTEGTFNTNYRLVTSAGPIKSKTLANVNIS